MNGLGLRPGAGAGVGQVESGPGLGRVLADTLRDSTGLVHFSSHNFLGAVKLKLNTCHDNSITIWFAGNVDTVW